MEDKKRNKYKEQELMLHSQEEHWEQYREPEPPLPFQWDAAKHSLLEPWHLFDEENWDKIKN